MVIQSSLDLITDHLQNLCILSFLFRRWKKNKICIQPCTSVPVLPLEMSALLWLTSGHCVRFFFLSITYCWFFYIFLYLLMHQIIKHGHLRHFVSFFKFSLFTSLFPYIGCTGKSDTNFKNEYQTSLILFRTKVLSLFVR